MSAGEGGVVRVERDGGVAVVTLNRPEKKNAIDLEMVAALREAFAELAGDDELAAVILTGGPKVFAAGADIGQLKARGQADALAGINSRLFEEVAAFPLPTIAALEGWVLGGGCELALACDLRVAGEGAKLGQPEAGLGILPAAGALYRLPRAVGLAKAKELVFTAAIVGAADALAMGLVNRLAPDGEALEGARALAGQIAKQDRLALRLAKSMFRALNPASPGVDFESIAQALCFESPEKHRRMQAFLDRKAAKKAAKADAKEAS